MRRVGPPAPSGREGATPPARETAVPQAAARTPARALTPRPLQASQTGVVQAGATRSHAALPAAARGHVALDMPAPTLAQQARALLIHALDDLPFAADLTPAERAAQQALQDAYIAHTTPALAARLGAYGRAHEPGRDMRAPWAEGRATALVDAVKGFLSSASRTPVRNAIVTRFERSQLTTQYDANVVGGFVGGVSAHAMDAWTLKAIDSRARAANLPEIKPVDAQVILPTPGRVQLVVGDGPVKSFRRLDEVEHARLVGEVEQQRHRLSSWQSTISAGGVVGSLFQGALGGVVNVLYRSRASSSALASPAIVGASTIALSGSVGFAAKGLSSVAKILPGSGQTRADDLVGGRRKLNLFTARPPRAGRPAAGYAALPRIGREALAEGWDHFVHSADLRHRGVKALASQTADVVRSALANAFASAISGSIGASFAA
ncbi:MAG: hypothetical protein ABW220_08460, partial [Burkholderiaceae bacterium]